MCCGKRDKKNGKSVYKVLSDSELIVRQTELKEDLDCAIAEAAVHGTISGGVLIVGACTGTAPVLIPGIIATTVASVIASSKAVRIQICLEDIVNVIRNRKKLS